jgi:hypothetical protein
MRASGFLIFLKLHLFSVSLGSPKAVGSFAVVFELPGFCQVFPKLYLSIGDLVRLVSIQSIP